MAVVIEFASLIIPRRYLEEDLAGGVDAYYQLCDTPTFMEDEHLTRVSFMATHSAIEIVDKLGEQGFPTARDCTPNHAIVDLATAPEAAPSWLSIGVVEGWKCAWWCGAPPGKVVTLPRSLALRGLSVNPETFREELRRLGIEWKKSMAGDNEEDVEFVGHGSRVEAFVFQDPPGGPIKGLLTHLPRCRHVNRRAYEKILEGIESVVGGAASHTSSCRGQSGEPEGPR